MAKKYWKHIISAIFFAAAFLFWRFGYACAFSYHEQFQMFLFTKSYFLERMSLPGGLADYISEFLVQFYYFPLFGAIIVSALLLGIQLITYKIIKTLGDKDTAYILSFVPVMFVWHYMGNESVLLSCVVAVLASLAVLPLLASPLPFFEVSSGFVVWVVATGLSLPNHPRTVSL